MISHTHRFIFVHTKKTAGLSIETALADLCEGVDSRNRHLTAAEIRDAAGTGVFDRYFKFSVVRNSWDRLVSLYHQKVQNSRMVDAGVSFRAWLLEHHVQRGSFRDRITQVDNLSDNGRLLIDFAARFERLHDDWRRLCERIGVVRTLPHVRRTATEHDHYRTYYDDETRRYVESHYGMDIERFGYEF
jgi:hypothetical protein